MNIETLKLSAVRNYRNQLLRESDWLILPDSPLPPSLKPAWIEYRQYLRDLPRLIDLSGDTWTDDVMKDRILASPPLKEPVPQPAPEPEKEPS